VLSWVPGTQTSSLLLRWSPEHGFTFPATLPPSVGSYPDSEPLTDPTYCYILLPYLGSLSDLDVRGISDLLCITGLSEGFPIGDAPRAFRVQLNESSRATLHWGAPGGQERYTLVRSHFGETLVVHIPLSGGETTYSEDIGNRTTCYTLAAEAGGSLLGVTTMLCAVPGVASFGPGP
jgi:hypothetical protein